MAATAATFRYYFQRAVLKEYSLTLVDFHYGSHTSQKPIGYIVKLYVYIEAQKKFDCICYQFRAIIFFNDSKTRGSIKTHPERGERWNTPKRSAPRRRINDLIASRCLPEAGRPHVTCPVVQLYCRSRISILAAQNLGYQNPQQIHYLGGKHLILVFCPPFACLQCKGWAIAMTLSVCLSVCLSAQNAEW
jgi:hypothetical protein